MTVLAHIAGIPVEETVLSFGPVALTGAGLAAAWVRGTVPAAPAARAAPRTSLRSEATGTLQHLRPSPPPAGAST